MEIKLFNYIKKYWTNMILISIIYLVIIFSSMGVPYYLGVTINHLEEGTATIKLILLHFGLVIALYFIWNTFSALLDVCFGKTNKSIETDIRKYCFAKIINCRYDYFQNHSEGEVLNKLMRDTEKIEKAFSNVFSLMTALIHSIILILVMMYVNMQLAIIISSLFIVLLVVQRITSKPMKNAYREYKDIDESLFKAIKNMLSGLQTIKIYSLEKNSFDLLDKRIKATYNKYTEIITRKSIVQNLNFLISSIFKVSTVFIGGLIYLKGKIKIGQIFTMYSYSIQLASYLRKIIELDIILKDIFSSINRLNEFLSQFKESDNKNLKEIKSIKKLEFREVSHSYGNTMVLPHLSFTANEGDVIGIKGSNGSGKTTLTYLISNLYEDNRGVLYNGIDEMEINEKDIKKRVSYVVQNPYLFPDTVINNITCFNDDLTSKAYSICKKLGIEGRINKLEEGYDTQIMENNQNISGGEKQLIALARSLVKECDILILDEFTSALDVNIKNNLLNNLDEYIKGKITFIISHEPKILDRCTKIIDLDKVKFNINKVLT